MLPCSLVTQAVGGGGVPGAPGPALEPPAPVPGGGGGPPGAPGPAPVPAVPPLVLPPPLSCAARAASRISCKSSHPPPAIVNTPRQASDRERKRIRDLLHRVMPPRTPASRRAP